MIHTGDETVHSTDAMTIVTRIATDQAGGIDAGPETEMMIGTTDAEAAIENIEAGEMTPAIAPGDGQTILLT